MRALARSAAAIVAVGLLTWYRSPIYALLMLSMVFALSLERSPRILIKAVIVASPLAVGLAWFNAAVALWRGGDPVATGVLVLARILTLAGISAYFAASTEPYELAEGISRIMPADMAYAFYTAYLLATRIVGYADLIIEAYRSRRLYRGPLDVIRLIKPFSISIIGYAYRAAESIGYSMESRGFSDERVFWRRVAITTRDLVEVLILVLTPVTLALLGI